MDAERAPSRDIPAVAIGYSPVITLAAAPMVFSGLQVANGSNLQPFLHPAATILIRGQQQQR